MKGTYLNDSVFCWVAASQDVGTRWCLSTVCPFVWQVGEHRPRVVVDSRGHPARGCWAGVRTQSPNPSAALRPRRAFPLLDGVSSPLCLVWFFLFKNQSTVSLWINLLLISSLLVNVYTLFKSGESLSWGWNSGSVCYSLVLGTTAVAS